MMSISRQVGPHIHLHLVLLLQYLVNNRSKPLLQTTRTLRRRQVLRRSLLHDLFSRIFKLSGNSEDGLFSDGIDT